MSDSSIISTFFQAMRPAAPDSANPDPGAGTPDIRASGNLSSAYPVTALAAASIGTAAQALAELMSLQFGICPAVAVDRRLASLWFGTSLRPQDWQVPAVRDPVTGDYQASDGWIRLHTNAPHHLAAALSVLKTKASHDDVAEAVRHWQAGDLEEAIVQAGGCAALMRSRQEWAAHAQGIAVKSEPLFHIEEGSAAAAGRLVATPLRPLAGLKILDLTRVLAGPVSTRFLAAYGAQVLRIDPPSWTEPGMVPEVTLGKRCAMLDLRIATQLEALKKLLAQADVIVHGYRADALEQLGMGQQARQAIRPGLVDVSLNAYGWTGPWKNRRGFDSLVQMSNGIACTGMRHFGTDKPRPLPVQALDQATGYLMAAAVLHGLAHRHRTGLGRISRLSLARTGELLASQTQDEDTALEPETDADSAAETELTDWGPAKRLKPPCELAGVPMQWDHPASALRSSLAQWGRLG